MTKQTELNLNTNVQTTEQKNQPSYEEFAKYLNNQAQAIDQNKKAMDSIDMQIAQLKMQKEQLNKDNENRENSITNTLDSLHMTEFSTDMFKFKPRNYTPKVIIDNKSMIPAKYNKQRIVVSIDKVSIKKDLQAGTTITGAHLEQTRSTKITQLK